MERNFIPLKGSCKKLQLISFRYIVEPIIYIKVSRKLEMGNFSGVPPFRKPRKVKNCFPNFPREMKRREGRGHNFVRILRESIIGRKGGTRILFIFFFFFLQHTRARINVKFE